MNPDPSVIQTPMLGQMTAPPQAAPPQQQPQNNGMAQLHYLDKRNYDEAVAMLVEYTGFVLAEAQKGESFTQAKLGTMLNIYVNNCLRLGPGAEEQAPAGATCEHVFIKGANPGSMCGKPAKSRGVDGLPKCSAHKSSKSTKPTSSGNSGPTPSGAAGQSFSYSANQGKGKIAPQSLTTIQAAIAEHTTPTKIELSQLPDGRVYERATNFVFEQRILDQTPCWVVIGVLEGVQNPTRKLTATDVHVCWGNQWKWDPACVDDASAQAAAHPLIIGTDHPLVNNQSSLLATKVNSIAKNSI
jgi:hypothetical protein